MGNTPIRKIGRSGSTINDSELRVRMAAISLRTRKFSGTMPENPGEGRENLCASPSTSGDTPQPL
jgi:hypothetical protein